MSKHKKGFSEQLLKISAELKQLADEERKSDHSSCEQYEKASVIVEMAADQVGRILFAEWS